MRTTNLVAAAWWKMALAVVVVAAVAASSQLSAQERPQRLSRSQLEALISIGTPDTAVASEIRQRGLGFALSASSIEDLRRKGAGANTIRALTALLPRTGLVIRTGVPDALVMSGATNLGLTDASGVLRTRLEPGSHDLTITAPGRPPTNVTVRLTARREQAIDVTLEAPTPIATGTLLVRSNVQSAVVEGIDKTVQIGVETPLPTGVYSLQVKHPCCETFSTAVTIAARVRSDVSAELRATPGYVETLIKQAVSSIGAGEFEPALQTAELAAAVDTTDRTPFEIVEAGLAEIPPAQVAAFSTAALERWPAEGSVQMSLGQSLAANGEWTRALEHLRAAVAGGRTVRLPVLHHQRDTLLRFRAGDVCPAVLEVSRKLVRFRGCEADDAFEARPLDVLVRERSNESGAATLRVEQGRGGAREFVVLPSTAEEIAKGRVSARNRSCDAGCQERTESLLKLLAAASSQ